MDVKTLSLEGNFVRLELLTLAHFEALCAIGFDESIWRWTTTQIKTPNDMRKYIEAALE